MTIDEAIKHAEEVVQEKQYEYQECLAVHDTEEAMNCVKCAEEHRQLAEWLKDYKRLLEQEPCDVELIDLNTATSMPCDTCEHSDETNGSNCYECVKGIRDRYNPQPCEDTISRENAIKQIKIAQKKGYTFDYASLIDFIKVLPPVNPQSKTGHWEWVPYDYNPKLGNWHCSECRSVVIECVSKEEKGGIPLYKYCPQCGHKMQERSDKE